MAVWNGESGDLLERVLDEGPIVAEVWVSADATRVAWRDESHGCMVRTIGADSRVQLQVNDVTKASFAADVHRAAIVRVDGQLSFWNLDTGMTGVPGTQPEILNVEVAPSGRWALSSHRNGLVRLWDTDGGRVVHEEANAGSAQIAFWASRDGDVAGWLWPSGAARSCRLPRMVISEHTRPEQAQLTGDPSILFLLDQRTTVVIDVESSTQVKTDHRAGPVAVVSDGRRLVAATPSFSRVLTIWDAGSGDVVARFTAGEGEIDSACWSPDGRVVVVAERVGTLHFLRLEGI